MSPGNGNTFRNWRVVEEGDTLAPGRGRPSVLLSKHHREVQPHFTQPSPDLISSAGASLLLYYSSNSGGPEVRFTQKLLLKE